MKYRIVNEKGGYCHEGTKKECEDYFKKNKLEHFWRIIKIKEGFGKLLGEGQSRIVYEDPTNDFWCIKVPKEGTDGLYWNKKEFDSYNEEQIFKAGGQIEIPNAIAKCFFDSETGYLYMEKLTPLKGSKNLGLNKEGICKTFDIF